MTKPNALVRVAIKRGVAEDLRADQDSDTVKELYAVPSLIFGDGFE